MKIAKLEKINKDISRLSEKITTDQQQLKRLHELKTEIENKKILEIVRGCDLEPDELEMILESFGDVDFSDATKKEGIEKKDEI